MRCAGGGVDEFDKPGQGGPLVYDFGCEVVCDSGVGPQGFEDGEDAGDFVGFEQLGQVGEGGDEDEACVGFGFGHLGGGRDEVLGQEGRGGVAEVESAGGCYCCAETLAKEDGAGGGVMQAGLDVGEE